MLMKISRLLVLSALWLVGLSANAADLIERTEPTNADVPKTAVAFVEGRQYLLYNVTAEKYFTQGNTWGTRGCVGPESSAVRIKVAKYTIDEVWDEATYEIQDYVSPRTGNYSWYKACANASGDIYTDQNGRGASDFDSFVEILPQGNNTYRIMLSTDAALNTKVQSDGTQFWGRDDAVDQDFSNAWADLEDDSERYPLSALLTEGDGHHIDWQFFDASCFDIFDAAESLKAVIQDAETAGIDVASAAAVYNNLNSTLEQINAAIAALKDAMANNIQNATGHNPQDASAWIVNGTFDTIGDFHGWDGTSFGAGGTTSTNAEHYSKTYDTYQDITVEYPGLYGVRVNAFYRAGSISAAYEHYTACDDESKYGRIYVSADGVENEVPIVSIYEGAEKVKPEHGAGLEGSNGYWIPNSMADTEKYMHQNGRYKNIIPVEVTGDLTLRIGVRKDVTIDTDWSIFDDFGLVYFGNGDDRYFSIPSMVADCIADVETEGEMVSEQYVEGFKSLKSNPTGNSVEAVLQYREQLVSAKAALMKNMSLWKELESAWNKAQADILNNADDFDQNSDSYIWLEDGKYDFDRLVSYDKTNEEIEEEIATINEMITDCLTHTSGNVDVTGLLKNADFSLNSWDGWTREAASGGNVQVSNSCAEAWNNANFDIYQEVQNAPVGVYRIQVQGFYRYLRGTNAWSNRNVYGKGKEKEVPCYVYMNQKATPFMNIFEELITDEGIYTAGSHDTFTDDETGTTYYYPNDMTTAAAAFASPSTLEGMEEFDMYTQTAWGIVAREGDVMRVGVKGQSNQGGDSWVIFDNFKLMRMEPTVEVVQPVLAEEIETAQALLAQPMGKTQRNALSSAVQAAATAVSGSNGQAMFDALQALFDAEDNCHASIEKFQVLVDAKKRLAIASEDAVTNLDAEVAAMMEKLDGALTQGTIEDEDVDALVEEVDALIVRLNTPDYSNASDSNPADFSGLIKNNSYSDNNQDGWTAELGKEGSDANYTAANGVGEVFNQNYTYYQDLVGLPAGTYELKVQAFYRAGYAADDYANVEDASMNNAYLYATTAEGDFAKAVVRLGSEPNSNETEEVTAGYAWAEEYVYEVANSTASADQEFAADKYHNTIILKVGEDGKLRLGLMKSSWIEKDWTCFDNWELMYYGKNSGKTPDGAGVNEMMGNNQQKVEFFTIDGRRIGSAHKGLVIMKQTMSNGNVVVKKTIK